MTTGSRAPHQGQNTRRPGGNAGRPNPNAGRRRRGRSVLKTEEINYKDVQLMRRFVSERGKLVSGRRVGVTAKNQRRLARAIKRAQHLALIPIAPNHVYITGSIQTETAQRAAEAQTETAEDAESTTSESSESTESSSPESSTQNDSAQEGSAAVDKAETETKDE